MDESHFEKEAERAFRRIADAFEDVDADDADIDARSDVINISFRGGARCVINTQRPTRQIWLAGGQDAWHFTFDTATNRWLDDKGRDAELFETLSRVVSNAIGIAPDFFN